MEKTFSGYAKNKWKINNFSDDNPDLIPERQDRLRQAQEAQKKQAELTKDALKPIPQYEVNGDVNPRYKTGRGSDILYGLTVGARQGAGQDPFFQLGSVLGGLLGGVFNKGVASRDRYQQDLAMTSQYNEQVLSKTDAEMRIEAQKERQQQQQHSQWIQDQRIALSQESNKVKAEGADYKKKKDYFTNLQQRYDSVTDPELRKELENYMESAGKDVWGENYDFIRGNPKQKPIKIGDYLGYPNEGGISFLEDKEGNPVVATSTSEYVNTYKKLYPDQKDLDVQASIERAKELTKDLKFKTDAQRSSAVLQVARMVQKGGKDNGSNSIVINGQELVVPSPFVPTKNQPQNQPKSQESPFMPKDIGEAPPVVDATMPTYEIDPKSKPQDREKSFNEYANKIKALAEKDEKNIDKYQSLINDAITKRDKFEAPLIDKELNSQIRQMQSSGDYKKEKGVEYIKTDRGFKEFVGTYTRASNLGIDLTGFQTGETFKKGNREFVVINSAYGIIREIK